MTSNIRNCPIIHPILYSTHPLPYYLCIIFISVLMLKLRSPSLVMVGRMVAVGSRVVVVMGRAVMVVVTGR